MRKVLISLAAAAATLAVAAPASAQAWGNATPGYGAPAYGYNNNFGQVRAFQAQVDAIQRQITILDRRNVLSNREARQLREESRHVERVLQRYAQYGLNPYEARNMQVRIAQLDRDVRRQAADGNQRWGRGYGDRDSDRGYDRDWDHNRR